MKPEWKSVRNFEKVFSVSSDGQIARTSLSWHGMRRRPIWRLLTPDKKPNGYLAIYLQPEGEERVRCYIHRLVWEAFRGAIPSGLEINHRNGVKDDNRLDNLELVTRSDNMLRGFQSLNFSRNRSHGATHHKAKLSEEDVAKIREMHRSKIAGADIARMFGVSKQNIYAIVSGKSWKHINQT